MKYVLIISIVFILCFMLCTCFKGGNDMLVPKLDEDQEYTNYLLNSLLNAMENKDKDKIISLFSKNIISNLQNIESDVDSLLEYFIGKPGIWDKQSPQIVDGSYEEDNKK